MPGRSDHEIVTVAVKQNGWSLRFAAECCRGDPEIVLIAVTSCGSALEFATGNCTSDHEIVLASVRHSGHVLKYAGEACRCNREIALAAVEQNECALAWVSDELLEDDSFAGGGLFLVSQNDMHHAILSIIVDPPASNKKPSRLS
eukprot:5543085-Amphidinium_carterae.3